MNSTSFVIRTRHLPSPEPRLVVIRRGFGKQLFCHTRSKDTEYSVWVWDSYFGFLGREEERDEMCEGEQKRTGRGKGEEEEVCFCNLNPILPKANTRTIPPRPVLPFQSHLPSSISTPSVHIIADQNRSSLIPYLTYHTCIFLEPRDVCACLPREADRRRECGPEKRKEKKSVMMMMGKGEGGVRKEAAT